MKSARKSNGNGALPTGNGTVTIPADLLDAIWRSLPLEKKAALLSHLEG